MNTGDGPDPGLVNSAAVGKRRIQIQASSSRGGDPLCRPHELVQESYG